jgi:CheY-like chemotaxis protein
MAEIDAGNDVNVLLVDDDQICRHGVRRALSKQGLSNRVFEARHGIEALEMLRGTNGRNSIPRPVTILLDLNMPQMTGHEFLNEIRDDPALQDSNVFVISTSMSAGDIQRCYRKNVAGYVTKSGGSDAFSDLACMLREYWRAVRLI